MSRSDAAVAARMERMYGSPEIVEQRARTRKVLAWADELRSRTGEGEYFFSVNRYLFLARRA